VTGAARVTLGIVGALVALAAGCGRIGFDAPEISRTGDASADSSDAPGSPDAPAQAVPAGAKIWLKMETDPNVGIVDSAGGHAVGCAAGCPTRSPALHGHGYAFAMEEVDVQHAADLDSSAGFTAAVWVDLTALPSSLACVWSKPFDGAAGFDTFTLCIDTAGGTVFDSESPAGVADSETGPMIAPGQWHHLAMSWDGTIKRGYLDGIQVAVKTVQLGSGTEAATLGGEGGAYYTPALVDDALYYTRALAPAEIQQLATP
jgi:hypothetical protein